MARTFTQEEVDGIIYGLTTVHGASASALEAQVSRLKQEASTSEEGYIALSDSYAARLKHCPDDACRAATIEVQDRRIE